MSGVEGILVKPLNGRYLPGYRGWTKIRRRDTTETIVGWLVHSAGGWIQRSTVSASPAGSGAR